MFESQSDEELAALAQKGERAGFNALVTRHHGRIYAFHRSSGNTVQDSEDYTQEAFLRAFKSLARYDCRQPFLPWLYTIARREAIRSWKKKKPTEALPPFETMKAEVCDRDLAPHLWYLARLHLKPMAYTALWLKYREDCSLSEIACSLKKSESATKAILYRARRELAEHLDPADFPPQHQLYPQPLIP